MSCNPKVSVLLCVRNAEATLDFAIKSILWQTFTEWELLILDDGSTDQSRDKAKAYTKDCRIRLFERDTPAGLASGLNFLLEQSRGEYIARMDADDISFAHRLQTQFDFLEANDEVDLTASSAIMFVKNFRALGKFSTYQSHDEIVKRANQGFFMPHPTWMGRKRWFLKYRYDESLKRGQDQDLLQRSYRESCFFCHLEPLIGYSMIDMPLSKRLKGRFRQVYFRYKYGSPLQFVLAAITMGLRALIDIVLFFLGMKDFLLRKSGLALSPDEKHKWQQSVKILAL